jgi:serine protease Do
VFKTSSLSDLAESLNGLPVHGCLPGSSAARAGVRYGDVLLSVDGKPTPTWQAYAAARQNSGSSMRVRLFRDGRELELDIALDQQGPRDAAAVATALGVHGDAPEVPEALN